MAQGADAGSGQLVNRAGLPTAVQPPGTSVVTTAPAPILAKSPILTSPRIAAPEPMNTPRPMRGERVGSSPRRISCQRLSLVAASAIAASLPCHVSNYRPSAAPAHQVASAAGVTPHRSSRETTSLHASDPQP